jgi:hypothetical protein
MGASALSAGAARAPPAKAKTLALEQSAALQRRSHGVLINPSPNPAMDPGVKR